MLLRLALFVIATLAAGCAVQTYRLNALRASVEQRAAEQREADSAAQRRIAANLSRIDHAAAKRRDQTADAAVRAAAAGNGLRIAAGASASAVTAAGCGADADTAAHLLADLPGRLDEAGRDVARHADELATALGACRAAYEAAVGPSEPPQTDQ